MIEVVKPKFDWNGFEVEIPLSVKNSPSSLRLIIRNLSNSRNIPVNEDLIVELLLALPTLNTVKVDNYTAEITDKIGKTLVIISADVDVSADVVKKATDLIKELDPSTYDKLVLDFSGPDPIMRLDKNNKSLYIALDGRLIFVGKFSDMLEFSNVPLIKEAIGLLGEVEEDAVINVVEDGVRMVTKVEKENEALYIVSV